MLHEYKDQTEILILCYTNTSNETGVIKIPNPRQTDLRLTDPRPCLNHDMSTFVLYNFFAWFQIFEYWKLVGSISKHIYTLAGNYGPEGLAGGQPQLLSCQSMSAIETINICRPFGAGRSLSSCRGGGTQLFTDSSHLMILKY